MSHFMFASSKFLLFQIKAFLGVLKRISGHVKIVDIIHAINKATLIQCDYHDDYEALLASKSK